MTKVSIVMPTRNRAALLPATIESARAASRDAEIIIVDDGSTDTTEDVCRAIGGINYIRMQRPVGTSEARNIAIDASKADYIAFLDDDDLRLPGTIDRQVDILDSSWSAGLVCARAFVGDWRFSLPTGWIIPAEGFSGDVFWRLLEANYIATSTVVARRTALVECGLFDPDLDTLEDYDLWVRLAERYRFEYLPEPVAVYRGRGDLSGQKTSDRALHERIHKALHLRLLDLPRAAAASGRARRAVHKRHMAIIYDSLIYDASLSVMNGNVEAARSYLQAAVRMRPFHPKAHGSLLWLQMRQGQLDYSESGRYPAGEAAA